MGVSGNDWAAIVTAFILICLSASGVRLDLLVVIQEKLGYYADVPMLMSNV